MPGARPHSAPAEEAGANRGHLSFYRHEQMSTRRGAPLSRQTMLDWILTTAEWCEAISMRILGELRAGRYLQADEIPVYHNDPDEPRADSFQGYLWVLSRPGATSPSIGKCLVSNRDDVAPMMRETGRRRQLRSPRHSSQSDCLPWSACIPHARVS